MGKVHHHSVIVPNLTFINRHLFVGCSAEADAACFSLRSSSIVAVVMMACKSCRIGPLSVNSFLMSTSCIIAAVVSQSNVRKYNTLIVDKIVVSACLLMERHNCRLVSVQIQLPDGY